MWANGEDVKVTADNYAELKAFFAVILPMSNLSLAGLPPEHAPVAVLTTIEARSMAKARLGLGMAIGDLVESFDGASAQQIAEIDQTLKNQDLPTLSAVRARFLKKTNAIMRRGLVRNESEFYALKAVADAMPDGEREKAWAMIEAFDVR